MHNDMHMQAENFLLRIKHSSPPTPNNYFSNFRFWAVLFRFWRIAKIKYFVSSRQLFNVPSEKSFCHCFTGNKRCHKNHQTKENKLFMNKIYRIVWNEARGAFVVAHEKSKANGKPSSTRNNSAETIGALVVSGLLAMGASSAFASPPANTLPSGYQVTAGAAAVSSLGNNMTVQQSCQNAAINWQSFSIGSSACERLGF